MQAGIRAAASAGLQQHRDALAESGKETPEPQDKWQFIRKESHTKLISFFLKYIFVRD